MQDFPTGIAYCITVACSASIIYFWSGHSHKAAWQVPCQLLLVGDLVPALSSTISALTCLRSPCHWTPPLILRSNYYCVAISQIHMYIFKFLQFLGYLHHCYESIWEKDEDRSSHSSSCPSSTPSLTCHMTSRDTISKINIIIYLT